MKKGLQWGQLLGLIIVIIVLIVMMLVAKNINTIKEAILNLG